MGQVSRPIPFTATIPENTWKAWLSKLSLNDRLNNLQALGIFPIDLQHIL
jgi:hypothetical protein